MPRRYAPRTPRRNRADYDALAAMGLGGWGSEEPAGTSARGGGAVVIAQPPDHSLKLVRFVDERFQFFHPLGDLSANLVA